MKHLIKSKREKLHYFTGLLFFFLLPFNLKFFPIVVGLWVVTWFLQKELKARFVLLWENKRALLLMAFYLLFAVSMIYSENLSKSLTDLEKKLSLFFMPLIFATANVYLRKNIKYLLLAFLAGTLVNVLISSSHFIFNILTDNLAYHDFLKSPFGYSYKNLSFINHSSYFAMFVTFSVAIFIYFRNTDFFTKKRNVWVTLFIVLLIGICILNSSRGGILALMFFLLVSFFYFMRNIYLKIGITAIMVSLLILGLSTKRFKNYSEVFTDFIQGKEVNQEELLEKHAVRPVLWKISIDIIKSNFWFGTGNGDIKVELDKLYQEKDVYSAIDRTHNPHNQYLSVFVGLGIVGFVFFVLLLLKPFIIAIKEKNYLLLSFLVIVAVHFLVESMLNRLSGIAFFSAFYSLLYIMPGDSDEEKSI